MRRLRVLKLPTSELRPDGVVYRVALNPVPLGRARVVTDAAGDTRAFTPERTRQFYDDFRRLTPARRYAGELDVRIVFWRRCRQSSHRGDVSNLVKAVEDAANGHLWIDDHQIRRLVAELVDSGPNIDGRFYLELKPYQPKAS